jgi:hypothetical protein
MRPGSNRHLPVLVVAMSQDAPTALFILDERVYYRPTGCPEADAVLIRLGVETAQRVANSSGTYPSLRSLTSPTP